LAEADLIVVVHDATRPWSEVEQGLCRAAAPVIVAHNKCDLDACRDREQGSVLTSATTGQGVEQLLDLISRTLVPQAPPPGSAVPFTAALVAALQAALASAASGDAPRALEPLRQLSSIKESVVDRSAIMTS
jgi:tRNA U34 5-carboxymethylaminomethyl modifying GTPase MnmE/TrmE